MIKQNELSKAFKTDEVSGRAIVAMSGGVDSSVAAYLTLEAGCEAVGVTMQLFGEARDAGDAEAVCERLGMDFCLMDLEDDFRREVIDRFIAEYEAGRTPNPCVICNKRIKFGRLFDIAMEAGVGRVVTGHYAKVKRDDATGRYLLMRAEDRHKDQTYVLYSLTQDRLAKLYLPIGEMTKEHTREIAEKCGFSNAHKHDSQDICFIPDGDYASFIERTTGKKYKAGDFVGPDGKVLGRHKGLIKYTIGQRKGLGLALPEPLYVCAKDAASNKVILGRNDALFSKKFFVKDVNYIACEPPRSDFKTRAKVRYSQNDAPCTVRPLSRDTAEVEFDEPQRAITCGQAAVFYDGDVVVGGGTIASPEEKQAV
ncbi:MAG: tRNA 2-thiouridine(34) synthase MnmA [Eubacterium sp.]|jgi:tRNA-specific 2-thiouridylase